VLKLTDLSTLLDDIDDQRRGREELWLDLLLALAVRADGANECARGYVRSHHECTPRAAYT